MTMLLVTFSGLDGCGKTTHVARTASYLTEQGWRVRSLATARISAGGMLSRLRETRKRRRSGSFADSNRRRHGVDSAGTLRPRGAERIQESRSACGAFQQTTPNRQGRALLHARQFLYPLDCLVLVTWIRVLSLVGYTAVVCDRYIYDKIVNLPRPDGLTARLMRWIAPRPDLAFVIDVAPEVARARRDEHETEYYATKYTAYLRLCSMGWDLRLIPGTAIDEAQHHVEQVIASVGACPPSPARKPTEAACRVPEA